MTGLLRLNLPKEFALNSLTPGTKLVAMWSSFLVSMTSSFTAFKNFRIFYDFVSRM